MALNVKQALSDAREAWVNNADYIGSNSATMAKALIAAGRKLLVLMPAEAGSPHANTRMEMKLIADTIAAAEAWLQANPTAGSSSTSGATTRGDVTHFRD